MALELKKIDPQRRSLNTDDTGILVQRIHVRNRITYVKNPGPLVIAWLRCYTDDYWKLKNPEEEMAEPEEPKEAEESAEGKPAEPKPKPGSNIQFVVRDQGLENPDLIFVATNLVDPGDFLHYVFDTMAQNGKGKNWISFPVRAFPVYSLCGAKSRDIEESAIPILEKLIGDGQAFRVSTNFFRAMDEEYMTQKEASRVVQNCIWSVNPNCVQCFKYQDYAFTINVVEPFFSFGYIKDFVKLRQYNSGAIEAGYDTSADGEDSDADLTFEELAKKYKNWTKNRIKRKRGAKNAGMPNDDGKNKKAHIDEEKTDGEGKEGEADGENGEKEENGDDVEAEAGEENGQDD